MNNEQRFGESLQAFADLLFTFDQYGMILECQFVDASIPFDACEQIHHKKLQDVLPAVVGNKLDHFISEALDNGRSSSFEFPLAMGEQNVWFDGCIVPAPNSRLILSARDITKYKQTEIRMQRQLQRLSALRSIDLAIASGLDLKLLLSILLDRVIETMRVDAAVVLLLDPEMNILKFGAGKGFNQTNILQYTRLKPGQGYAGRAVLERRMINVQDLTKHATEFDRSPLFPSERFVVYYGIPLVAKGCVLGVLEIFHRSHLNPDEDWLNSKLDL